MLSYRLDAQGKILSLNGDWDKFSRENGGGTGLEEAYVGRPLWDFIADFDTQSYLNALLFYVRQTQQPVSIGYRCDAPDQARGYRMELLYLPKEDAVQLNHHPLPLPALGARNITDFAAYRGRPAACSQCLMVQINDRWVDSFGLASKDQFDLRYTVCPSCQAATREAVGAAQDTGWAQDYG